MHLTKVIYIEIKKEITNNEEDGFILISYKSKTSKSQWSEKKAKKFCKILEEIISITSARIRVLFTKSDKNKKRTGERLYHLIKEKMYKNEKNYHRFHTFVFIDNGYINNWFTDIEYGISFANSRMSKYQLPIDITVFSEDKKKLKEEINRSDPMSFDDILPFNKNSILKEIKEAFGYLINDEKLISKKEEEISKIINKNL